MSQIVNELYDRLNNRELMLGAESASRGLLYIKTHIEQQYLPAVDVAIEELEAGLRKARRQDRQLAQNDLDRVKGLRTLLTHDNGL